MDTMTTYLVTGGAGFIGLNLVKHLLANGYRVRVLDNFSTGSVEGLQDIANRHGKSLEIVEGDIRDRRACQSACRNVEYILHHAAMASVTRSLDAPDECIDVNISGTNNILMSAVEAGSVQRMVFASSCAVYGDTAATVKRESGSVQPLTVYATTKLMGEYLCNNFFYLHGLPTVALRYFNVYGPGQGQNGPYAAVIPRFCMAVHRQETPMIYGDGRQTRDFIYISDVVGANMIACNAKEESVAGQTFNIGSGCSTSLNQLLDLFGALTGRKICAEYLPPRKGDVRQSRASIDRARHILNFHPAIPIAEGLAMTMECRKSDAAEHCLAAH